MFYHTRLQFHSNKVLKAEVLQEGMDYAWEMLEHIYASYSDGIIEGVAVTEQGGYLIVHPGIIKRNGILYHMRETEKIPYEHSSETVYLRIRFADASQAEERTQYMTEMVLTTDETDFPYEMEIGRFVAEQGASLQMDYKDFSAVSTRYNQFDISRVPFAGIGKSTIAPRITTLFAEALWEKHSENMYDIAFAMQGLSRKPIERDVICHYLSARLRKDAVSHTNEQICQAFAEILRMSPQQNGRRQPARGMERRLIVD